jgi:hypothetical protein
MISTGVRGGGVAIATVEDTLVEPTDDVDEEGGMAAGTVVVEVVADGTDEEPALALGVDVFVLTFAFVVGNIVDAVDALPTGLVVCVEGFPIFPLEDAVPDKLFGFGSPLPLRLLLLVVLLLLLLLAFVLLLPLAAANIACSFNSLITCSTSIAACFLFSKLRSPRFRNTNGGNNTIFDSVILFVIEYKVCCRTNSSSCYFWMLLK